MSDKERLKPEDVIQVLNEEIGVYAQHNTNEHPTLHALRLGRQLAVQALDLVDLLVEAREVLGSAGCVTGAPTLEQKRALIARIDALTKGGEK